MRRRLLDVIDKITTIIVHVVIALTLAFLLAWAVFIAVIGHALAHDIYTNVWRNGYRCCTGDKDKGDCEPLTFDQIHYSQGGKVVVIDSKRYGHPVLLPYDRIEWLPLAGEIPGQAGHWCGSPRNSGVGPSVDTPPSDMQPDPSFFTWCVWINPGSV